MFAPRVDLLEFPLLAAEVQNILQPLPGGATRCGGGTPFEGYSLAQVASSPEPAVFGHQTLELALQNQPLTPELYRLALYLYGRVRLLHGAVP